MCFHADVSMLMRFSDTQERNFKLLSRWYRIPVNLHRIFLSQSELCWCCRLSMGDFLHVWWACPPINKLWERIINLYNIVTGESVHNSAEVTLLSLLPLTLPRVR